MKAVRLIGGFVVIFVLFFIVGCSSSLRETERGHSLRPVEVLNGIDSQSDNFGAREDSLAKVAILTRDAGATKKGYPILIRNALPRNIKIVIKKASFLSDNPITSGFNFSGEGCRADTLMPGKYEAQGWISVHFVLWSQTFEVTSAYQWDAKTGQYYHVIVGEIDPTDYGYGYNNLNGYGGYYHRRPPLKYYK